MKRVKLGRLMLFWIMAAGVFINQIDAQGNWDAQQKEVWSNVETYWSLQAKGDMDGFMSYFSDSYMGWDYNAPVPQNKTASAKYFANSLKSGKSDFYNITPVAILIYGNIAIVDYYYEEQLENAEGKKSWHHGRWTDILMKVPQGVGKWVMIADHGGEAQEKN